MSKVKKGYYDNLIFSVVKDIIRLSELDATHNKPTEKTIDNGRYLEAAEYSTSMFGEEVASDMVTEKDCCHCGMSKSCYFDFVGICEQPTFICLACGHTSTKI